MVDAPGENYNFFQIIEVWDFSSSVAIIDGLKWSESADDLKMLHKPKNEVWESYVFNCTHR